MWKDYFDLDMSPILPYIPNSNLRECAIETIESSQLVRDAQLIQSIDLRTVRIDDLHILRSVCEFSIDNSCIISGFCFWFDCYFSSNNNSSILRSTRLTTNPHSSKTHWKQTLVFLPHDIYPLKGDIVPVNIKLEKSLNNRRQYNLSIVIKKIKVGSLNSNGIEDENSNSELFMRRRQRRRSSTISFDKRLINDKNLFYRSNDSTSSNSDDDTVVSKEHPVPCSCVRDRCKLVKTIYEKNNEDSVIQ